MDKHVFSPLMYCLIKNIFTHHLAFFKLTFYPLFNSFTNGGDTVKSDVQMKPNYDEMHCCHCCNNDGKEVSNTLSCTNVLNVNALTPLKVMFSLRNDKTLDILL